VNFYPFHIGDYASATRHLSWTEDAAYRRLLDVYYVREAPLPTEARLVYRLVLASTEEQREAVDTILGEFFELTPDGYRHKRCDVELAAAKEKSAKAAQSARARWGDAKQQPVAVPEPATPHTDRNANASSEVSERTEEACVRHAPKTNPKTKEEPNGSSGAAYAPPEWVPTAQWADFVRMRKAMRNVPFTGAAARGVVAELEKLRAQGHDPVELLQLAVTSGWRTVYPPKQAAKPVNGGSAEPAWRSEQRERTQIAAPGVAAHREAAADFFEAETVTPVRRLN
jgi:uncharacterized protein YdaU (DUF1376 family)